MSADWGSGFAVGLAAGKAKEVEVEVAVEDKRISRKYEKVIIEQTANVRGHSVVRTALQNELRKLDPTNPLISPSGDFLNLGPEGKRLFDEEKARIMNGGFFEDPDYHRMTPHHVADWKKERLAPFKAEYEKELKAAEKKIGFMAALAGKKADIPPFEEWMEAKGLNPDTGNALEVKG